MGDNWKVGDIARCVEEFGDQTVEHPKIGACLTVKSVRSDNAGIALSFEGYPDDARWDADAFQQVKKPLPC